MPPPGATRSRSPCFPRWRIRNEFILRKTTTAGKLPFWRMKYSRVMRDWGYGRRRKGEMRVGRDEMDRLPSRIRFPSSQTNRLFRRFLFIVTELWCSHRAVGHENYGRDFGRGRRPGEGGRTCRCRRGQHQHRSSDAKQRAGAEVSSERLPSGSVCVRDEVISVGNESERFF